MVRRNRQVDDVVDLDEGQSKADCKCLVDPVFEDYVGFGRVADTSGLIDTDDKWS